MTSKYLFILSKTHFLSSLGFTDGLLTGLWFDKFSLLPFRDKLDPDPPNLYFGAFCSNIAFTILLVTLTSAITSSSRSSGSLSPETPIQLFVLLNEGLSDFPFSILNIFFSLEDCLSSSNSSWIVIFLSSSSPYPDLLDSITDLLLMKFCKESFDIFPFSNISLTLATDSASISEEDEVL